MEIPPSQRYLQLQQGLLARRALYVDPDFPAENSSIGGKHKYDIRIRWRRPGEIQDNPKFMIGGMERSDIHQGIIRDCFLLAGAAVITVTKPALLFRVAPPDQNFGAKYTGMFRFNFWQYDRWVEVIIDDRLPVIGGKQMNARNRYQKNEFWISLLEKAYAKLYGSYMNIDTGFVNEALTDMTGGVGEIVRTEKYRNKPAALYELIMRTLRMSSMMGCAVNIEAGELELGLNNGLFEGHAYSITRLDSTMYKGKRVQLIRLRNPWGKKEWRGSWNDDSSKWDKVSDAEKMRLEYYDDNDGEFWMEFNDWMDNFEGLYVCHITPDGMMDEINLDTELSSWNDQVFHGNWIPGVNAGGCGNKPYKHLFWTNPQYMLNLSLEDDFNQDGRITLCISLSQKGKTDETNEYINFLLYKVRPGVVTSVSRQLGARELIPIKRDKNFINVRDISDTFRYRPGKYVVIPCTFKPNTPGQYALRVFSETHGRQEPSLSLSMAGVYA